MSQEHISNPGELDSTFKPQKWSTWMLDLYVSQKGPLLGTTAPQELEDKARDVLKDRKAAFMYVFGSAGTCTTYRDNRAAFDTWKIIPRMLVDATERSLATTIFGKKLPSPLLIAPIGVQGIMHPDAELATARAAKNVGVPMIMSTASCRSIEDVAETNGDGHRWYQIYWPTTDVITVSLLSRAKAAGFSALVVTLDTPTIGWRPHDHETAYIPFWHSFGCQVGTSDPVFMKSMGHEPRPRERPQWPYDPAKENALIASGDKEATERLRIGREWLKETSGGKFRKWEDLKLLRDNWEGPLVLKGIQNVLDAEKALDHGVDGFVVSNHGGRQVDGALPSLYALDTICSSPKIQEAQKSGKLTVLFDSGIRTGSDIIKAFALGAQGILLGRPFMYGLALGGDAGVEQVVRATLCDLDITLGLAGYTTLDEIWGKRDAVLAKAGRLV